MHFKQFEFSTFLGPHDSTMTTLHLGGHKLEFDVNFLHVYTFHTILIFFLGGGGDPQDSNHDSPFWGDPHDSNYYHFTPGGHKVTQITLSTQ